MWGKRSLLAALILPSLLVCPFANPQRHEKPNLREDVDLPPDFAVDFELGLAERGRIRGNSPLLENTPLNEAGRQVFSRLVQNSSISSLGLPYQWNLTITDNNGVNAHSLPDGEISVDSGLAKLIGTSPGLWAAVLSHETTHTARRHGVRQYLYSLYIAQQIAYYQARVRAGDDSANWSIVVLRITAPMLAAKMSRNMEHEADVQGMLMMAREGYHPDYVFALHHLLRAVTGEQSKFAAFFSSHPRWETRDQRADRAYADALAEYNRLWPDPDSSPGGKLPLVVFLGKPNALENKKTKTADLTLPMFCRNATQPLRLIIHFRKKGRLMQAQNENYRNERAELEYSQGFVCEGKDDASPLTLKLPASMVSKDSRKVQAIVDIHSSEGQFLERFKPFDVHFPKP